MSKATEPLILVVEDERAQLDMLLYNLEQEKFALAEAGDGDEALALARDLEPDLILLDWMLPNVSGIEVCRQLKARAETRHIPILMLTARGEEENRVRGLNTGADDYVTKPYSVSELIARIRAILRRTRPASVEESLSYGDIVVNLEQHKVSRGDKAISLGPTEFRLLTTFMERPGRVWSRDQLLDRVWGRDVDVDFRTVDVHVGRLRKSLTVGGGTDPIRTVRGAGYALDLDQT